MALDITLYSYPLRKMGFSKKSHRAQDKDVKMMGSLLAMPRDCSVRANEH